MSPEVHQKVRRIFDEAVEKPDAERAAFLEQACAGNPEVLQAVTRLLEARLDASSFLDRPTHRTTRIDRYLIKSELGHGAMGTVYEAVDPVIGRTIAIKVIALPSNDLQDSSVLRESLFREARSAGGRSTRARSFA